jgi:Bacterial membrane flanked domain.
MTNDKGRDKIPDAYDVEGRPLFYHPASDDAIRKSEKTEGTKGRRSKAALVKLRHDRSANDYPDLKLGEDEYVELSVVRHKIGYFLIWVGEVSAIVLLLTLWIVMMTTEEPVISGLNPEAKGYISVAIFAVCLLSFLFGWIGMMIYKNNHFYVTNKRVIQHAMHGLFDRTVQTIDLDSVEDISYRQSGILQILINYGTIRLSTIGDETTYQFNFVQEPKEQIRGIIAVLDELKKQRASVGGRKA